MLGKLTALPRPIAGLKGPFRGGGGEMEGEDEGRKGARKKTGEGELMKLEVYRTADWLRPALGRGVGTIRGIFRNLKGGSEGTFQVYIFKSVQIVAYFFTLTISRAYIFSSPKGQAGARAPP